MNQHSPFSTVVSLILVVAAFVCGSNYLAADQPGGNPDGRPNVVWIIADDLGPELGCYGYPQVQTPHIDRLANSGILFQKAFATAPVCSSSRTAFQTGRYQTSVGGHHHNTRDKRKLPDDMPTVTELMQKAGYFVCNGRGIEGEKRMAKSHLNFVYDAKQFFDGTDWSQRSADQPFFAQVQIKEPHRPFVKHEKNFPNAPIPPYYPEHPITRADWENYLASIEILDQKVGRILDRLDKEGIADNTIVILFGDHGRPHVRGKQWLYDGGLHVPLIVRWPAKIKKPTKRQGLVSLLDLMPTTLAVANAEIPIDLPGQDLLATDWRGHLKIFAARDRCGDAPDRIRCVRTERYKYIRNFRADLPYLQLSSYKKLSYPVDTLMRVLHAQGKWDSPMMAKTRPEEELYDLKTDPHELNNLANDPMHQSKLRELRTDVKRWINDSGDLGALDEKVDLPALMEEKKRWYEKVMRSRGLDPEINESDYLEWWYQELGVAQEAAP